MEKVQKKKKNQNPIYFNKLNKKTYIMKIQLNRLDVISFVHTARALSSALWSKSKTNQC